MVTSEEHIVKVVLVVMICSTESVLASIMVANCRDDGNQSTITTDHESFPIVEKSVIHAVALEIAIVVNYIPTQECSIRIQ